MTSRTKPKVHPVDEAWLALGTEQPLEPDLDIVDSHIHLWDFSDPPYYADDYAADALKAGVSASVYVDCTMAYREDGPEELAPVGEVEFARAQAEACSSPVNVAAGIVGWADLRLGDAVGPVLDELIAAGGGRLRGVRCRANFDPDPVAGYGAIGASSDLMSGAEFRRGVACVEARGLVLDLYVFHTQLDQAAELASAFPGLTFVLNQIGGPLGVGPYADKRAQVFADWHKGLALVAQCPNVMLKVGGFAISRLAIVDAHGLSRPPSSTQIAETCRPWVEHCLAQFGPSRCMFGSNFPVDKVAMPLLTLVNAMKLLTAGLTLDEQRRFFSLNAKEVYQI